MNDVSLMTASATAKMLSCSRITVDRMAADGRLPQPIRLGRLVRWDRAAVVACIAAQQVR